MADRKLRRVGLDEDTLHLLESKHYRLCKDILSKTSLELLADLDLPYELILDIQQKVSQKITPAHKTITNLINEPADVLVTNLPGLDDYLRGGLPVGSVTEIVGPAGVGKTQFCHQMVVLALLQAKYKLTAEADQQMQIDENNPPARPDFGKVFYYDTENSFSTQRLYEIAAATDEEYFSSEENMIDFTERCMIYKIRSTDTFLTTLQNIEEKIIEENVKMIIVDSIASLVRKEFDPNNLVKRQNILSKTAALLKFYSMEFKIPILVVNQVTSSGGSYVAPALGPLWSHAVNTRLVLEYYKDHPYSLVQPLDLRRLIIAKSPVSPVVKFPYFIDNKGIHILAATDVNDESAREEGVDYVREVEPGNYWSQTIQGKAQGHFGTSVEHQHTLITRKQISIYNVEHQDQPMSDM
jgi:RAD51-like protein 1